MKKLFIGIFIAAFFSNPKPALSFANEFLLDTNVVYGPTYGAEWAPAVAFDGINYLVVWSADMDNIVCTRVNKSGKILDSCGIIISAGNGSERQENPSVAFDGTNYLVVWSYSPSGSSPRTICGARVSTSGEILDTQHILISYVTGSQYFPKIAFGDSNYLVVWQRNISSWWDIYGARVSKEGTVLDPSAFSISPPVSNKDQSHSSIAFDGNNYLVVWQREWSDQGGIYGSMVSTSGTVLCTLVVSPLAVQKMQPSVAFDGNNYLVAWKYKPSGSTYSEIHGARVNTSGILLDSSGINIIPGNVTSWQFTSVAFDGTNYLLSWTDERDSLDEGNIYTARINPAGTLLDTINIPVSTAKNEQSRPAVAFGDTNCLIVWWDQRNYYTSGTGSFSDIYGARINKSGTVLDSSGILMSSGTNQQSTPSISFDGEKYLVAWQDCRNGYWDIFGIHLNESGDILDPQSVPICTDTFDQCYPCITFGDTGYFAVWEDLGEIIDDCDIRGSRLNKSGVRLDIPAVNISTYSPFHVSPRPRLAFDGENYFAVWEGGSCSNSSIYGARINQDGKVLDSVNIGTSCTSSFEFSPCIAFDGNNYLVVWEDNPYLSNESHIRGTRVTKAGVILDSNHIAISNAAGYQGGVSVAFDGTHYFVVWIDIKGTGPYIYSVYGARVDTLGTLLDTNGISICNNAGNIGGTAVAFDGTDYLVAWDCKNGDFFDIYGAKVSSSGVVKDSFAITTQPGDQHSPVLIKGKENQMLIAWQGWAPAPYNSTRIWGKLYPFVGVEESNPVETNYNLYLFPNPTLKSTVIKYHLSAKTPVSLKLFDISGRCVKTLINEQKPAGSYSIPLATKDLTVGIYFIKLKTNNYEQTKKLILMK